MIRVGDTIKVKSSAGSELRSMGFDREYCQQIQEEYSGTMHRVNYVWTDQNKQLFCTIETGIDLPISCVESEETLC